MNQEWLAAAGYMNENNSHYHIAKRGLNQDVAAGSQTSQSLRWVGSCEQLAGAVPVKSISWKSTRTTTGSTKK
jgi:hypothetical protein